MNHKPTQSLRDWSAESAYLKPTHSPGIGFTSQFIMIHDPSSNINAKMHFFCNYSGAPLFEYNTDFIGLILKTENFLIFDSKI